MGTVHISDRAEEYLRTMAAKQNLRKPDSKATVGSILDEMLALR